MNNGKLIEISSWGAILGGVELSARTEGSVRAGLLKPCVCLRSPGSKPVGEQALKTAQAEEPGLPSAAPALPTPRARLLQKNAAFQRHKSPRYKVQSEWFIYFKNSNKNI